MTKASPFNVPFSPLFLDSTSNIPFDKNKIANFETMTKDVIRITMQLINVLFQRK